MKRRMRNILFGLFLMALLLPALQGWFGMFPAGKLHGAFIPAEMPAFTWKRWFSSEFQNQYDRYTEDHIGFRTSLVKIKNQLDFSLFRKANAEGVVVGKKDYLYEYDYIRDYTGKDFVGMDFIRKKMMRVAFVQKYLKDSLDIDFVIVFEPGKASFYPEYIPDSYLRGRIPETNYLEYKKLADQLGVKYIDFNRYFLDMKDTSHYPLFPRYGTHWSVYGMSFAADSLLNHIERLRGKELREVRVAGYEVSDEPRDTDNDVELPLNLVCPLPSEQFAYPVWHMDTVGDRYRPRVLAVADSYYWNFFNTRIPKHIFANEAFWYFNTKVYPDTYINEKLVKDLDIKNEVEKQDVILLMVTERFLHKFDWQFVDMVYGLFAPSWLQDPVYDNVNRIIEYDPWFKKMIAKAETEQTSLEEALKDEARFIYYSEQKGAYFADFGVGHFMHVIRDDQNWYGHIREKAVSNNLTAEEQLRMDAEYVFRQNEPALFEIHQAIAGKVNEMESDFDGLDLLEREASSYGCPLEDYIYKKAKMMVKEEVIRKTENAIRSTPGWLADVQAKAAEKGISIDQMIHMDAVYIWEQKLK